MFQTVEFYSHNYADCEVEAQLHLILVQLGTELAISDILHVVEILFMQ